MADGIRIDDLDDAMSALLDMAIPVMRNNQTFQVSVQEIRDLVADYLRNGAPVGLDTFLELAAAVGNDPAFATVTNAALAARLLKAGGTMTGNLDMNSNNILNAKEGVPDYLNGLITVRASATTITVGTGWMKSNGLYVKNSANLTKSLSTAWSAGAGGGALDTGVFSASATYFLHALRKNSDGSFEFLSSLSPTAPTVPAGFTLVGRFWANIVASSSILDYTQNGNKCVLAAAIAENSLTTSFAKALVTLTGIPNNLSVDALLDLSGAISNVVNASVDCRLFDGYLPTGTTSYSQRAGASSATTANSVTFLSTGKTRTNASRQIWESVNYTIANGTAGLITLGWEDYQLPRVGV